MSLVEDGRKAMAHAVQFEKMALGGGGIASATPGGDDDNDDNGGGGSCA